MTQQYTGRNNVTISMRDGGSIPIVSQTEIDPMKTALPSCSRSPRRRRSPSRCPCRSRSDRAAAARLHRERLILYAVNGRCRRHRQAEQWHLPVGMDYVGAFLQGLQQWGWTVGGNVRIDIRFGADNAATRKHARDLASLAPDVILAMPIPSSEGKSAAQTDGTHAHAQHACRDNDFDV